MLFQYITEISPANKYGYVCNAISAILDCGDVLVRFSNIFCMILVTWHQYLYNNILVSILLVLACILPPSPTWLVLMKRHDDAYTVLETQVDLSDSEIKKHIDEIRVMREHAKLNLQKILIGKDIWPVLLVTGCSWLPKSINR